MYPLGLPACSSGSDEGELFDEDSDEEAGIVYQDDSDGEGDFAEGAWVGGCACGWMDVWVGGRCGWVGGWAGGRCGWLAWLHVALISVCD